MLVRTVGRSVTKLSKGVCPFNQFAGHSVSCALAYVDYADENPSSKQYSDLGQMHRKMCDLAKCGEVGDALKVLNSMLSSNWRPSVSDYNRLLYCYLKSGNMVLDNLVTVYANLRENGVFPNAVTYNVLYNGLISLGCVHDALNVVVEMHRNGYSPSFQCLSKLLKKLLSLDQLEDSAYVVDFMLMLGYSPTEPVLNTLMSKLTCSGMLNEAYRVLNMMLCKGNFCSPNPIFWALCKYEGSVVVALSFWCCMKKRGFVRNICSYNALAYGFYKHGLLNEVGKVFTEMDGSDVKPDVFTYTIIVKHLCENGEIEEAIDILYKMEKDGCQPDMVIYNVLFRGLSRSNRIAGIGELCSILGQKGLSPDSFTYSAIAGGLLKSGHGELADQILDEAISRRDCKLDVGVYNSKLHAQCMTDRSSEALSSVLQKMEEEDLTPNSILYNIVLKWLCLEGNLEKALQFLDKFEPDGVSVNTILSAACKLRYDFSMIDRVLKKTQCLGIKLSVVSFTCLIRYFCLEGQLEEGFKCLEFMMFDYGIRPSTITLNVLIHGVCKGRLLSVSEAGKIFDWFRSIGIYPDSTTFNILLHAASLRARAEVLGNEFLREMDRQGVKPDMVTYGTIINTRCKMGKITEISDAYENLNMMLENGVCPDVVIYNNFLSALLRRMKYEDASMLLKHMVKHKCEPDLRSAEIILRAMVNGRLKGSEKLLEFVCCGKGLDASEISNSMPENCGDVAYERLLSAMVGRRKFWDALSLLIQSTRDRGEVDMGFAEIILRAMLKSRMSGQHQ